MPFRVSVLLSNGDGAFEPPVTYNVGLSPGDVTVGDFNLDGRLDVAAVNTSSDTVSVLLGNGDGTLQEHVEYGTGVTPTSVAIGDFNGDERPDLATANLGDDTVSILLGNGDGTFQTHHRYVVARFTQTVTTGDLNGDGIPDVVASGRVANAVSILLGNGDGTFLPRRDYGTDSGPQGLTTGDFNSDGGLDLAVSNDFANTVSVLLNVAVVAFSSAIVAFDDQPVGTASPARSLLISNPGGAPLHIAEVSVSGEFAAANTCPSTLAPGASCEISVTFLPPAAESYTGSLVISDSAASSPHVIPLRGSGTTAVPVVGLSATSLDFGTLNVGITSAAQTLMLSNAGDATLNITSIAISENFAQSGDCGANLEVGASCSLLVTFTPATTGPRNGTLTVTSNSPASPHLVALSGRGADFSLALSPGSSASATLLAGQTASFNLALTPDGFIGNVTLSCSGAPSRTTCTVSPRTATLDGLTRVEIEVSVATTARSMAPPRGGKPPTSQPHRHPPLVLWLLAAGVLAMLWAWNRRRLAQGLAAALLALALVASCGGGGSAPSPQPGTPQGTYTITVTATAGDLSRSTQLELTVR